mmetsp:Transcript_21898/g.65784  ORF Transcript_21898/g.65784 Transcript_21898/m.65784 type:complete len:113 (+) Transcript_21898:237-575(+)
MGLEQLRSCLRDWRGEVPETWTGRPVAAYLWEDDVRTEIAEAALDRAIAALKRGIDAGPDAELRALSRVFRLNAAMLTRVTSFGFDPDDPIFSDSEGDADSSGASRRGRSRL